MPPPRKPRIRARLAGPSGLAAALALGAAGPASASVHRAAVAGPGPGWAPTAAAATDSPLGALAILGACGVAGFLLLVLGRRKDVDEPAPTAPPAPDLEAMMRPIATGPGPSATSGDGGPSPVWVKRLNDQGPPAQEPSRVMDTAYRG